MAQNLSGFSVEPVRLAKHLLPLAGVAVEGRMPTGLGEDGNRKVQGEEDSEHVAGADTKTGLDTALLIWRE